MDWQPETDLLINADFGKAIAIATDSLPWLPSPLPGVRRRMLDRIGGEVARATSLVQYAPGSRFSPHEHERGEEFLVLSGVFSDEHGDYPEGSYVRNPPGSRHAPFTAPGCTIFVKLRQMHRKETGRLVMDTKAGAWLAGEQPGVERMPLFAGRDGEVALERLTAGAELPAGADLGGEELLVLDGLVECEEGRFGRGAWIRCPIGPRGRMTTGSGVVYWVKRNHLRFGEGRRDGEYQKRSEAGAADRHVGTDSGSG